MPNKHKNPFLGWNPPAEDSAWARAEAERRGVALSTVLTEALQEYRAARSAKHLAGPVPVIAAGVEPPPKDCKHKNMKLSKGVCPDCSEWVTK